jgi:hypothetical protein
VISSLQIWVETSYFKIEDGEDRETSPGRLGRSFANWVAGRLKAYGEPVQQVRGEDWGWCVLLAGKPYRLWVGCGNRAKRIDEWGAFVAAEPKILQRLFRSVDVHPVLERVERHLDAIMHEVPRATAVWKEGGLGTPAFR